MYNIIRNAILPYVNESDPVWEEFGVESVITIFETFSTNEWECFIQEIQEDVPDIDVRLIDCLTQMDSTEALMAAVEMAKICSESAFTLFVIRLDDGRLAKISHSDLALLVNKACLQEKNFQGRFAVIYKEATNNMRKFLKV